MLPQELKAMGTDKEVILFEGIPHPVKCDKIRYYEDKLFTARLLSKVDVPIMQLEGSLPMGKKTIALAGLMSLALAGLAQASSEPAATTLGSPSTAPSQDSRPAEVAKNALGRFLAFIGTIHSTSELTKESIGKAMGVVLVKSEGGDAYTSPAFAGGWS
jgi:type IV secretion system protein VirD4